MSHHLPPRSPIVPFAAAVHASWRGEAVASLQLAAVLGLLWLGLFGGKALLFGSVAIVATVLLSRAVAPLHALHFSPFGLVRFAAYFLIQSIAGGIDVARRALHWRLPLQRGTWRYPLRLPPGQSRLLFIAAIGLLPGTVAQRTQGDELWVHSIAGDPQRHLAQLEQRVAGLYGITLSGDGR